MSHASTLTKFACAAAMAVIAVPAIAQAATAQTPRYASYYYQSEPSATPYTNQTTSYTYDNKASASAASSPTADLFNHQDWDITLGLGVVVAPKYPGADTHQVMPVPMFSVVYRKDYFLNERGLGANLIHWNDWTAGLNLGWDGGRDNKDAARLNNLGDIAPSLNAGGFVAYQMGSIELRTDVRHAITHADSYGTSGDFKATYRGSIIPGTLDFSAGPQIDVADSDYMQTWFGVPRDRIGNGLNAFDAKWGVKDIGLNGSLSYHVSPQVMLRSFVGVKELLGDANDSPITQDSTQLTGGVGIAYHF